MQRLGRDIAVAGIWLGIALAGAIQSSIALGDQTPGFAALAFDSIVDWGSCGVFTPVVVWLVRRFPVVHRPVSHGAIHLAAIAALTVAKFACQYAVLALLRHPAHSPLVDAITRHFLGEAIVFAAMTLAVHAVVLHDRLRTEQTEALTLRAELADSRLDALIHKIEPHFLFNTLQAISTLVHRDPRAADAMLTGLSDMLRELLRSDAPHEVPVAVELDTARRYLDIMRVRFGERLTISIDAAAEVERALVPRLVLQPLLENALRHGVASTTGPARLELWFRRVADRLEIAVSDNGRAGEAATRGTGVGLANTRERLLRLYGAAAQLETRRADDGFRVTLALPFRTAS